MIKVGVDRILKFFTISAEPLNKFKSKKHDLEIQMGLTSISGDLNLAKVESGDVSVHHVLQCGLEEWEGSLTVGAPRRIELETRDTHIHTHSPA